MQFVDIAGEKALQKELHLQKCLSQNINEATCTETF